MSNNCPNCGTPITPDARFCRTCGASLHPTRADETPVSPLASTVSLADERTASSTDGLSDDAANSAARASHTQRVDQQEMEEMLRGTPGSRQSGANASIHTSVAPTSQEAFDPERTLIVNPHAQTMPPPGRGAVTSILNSPPTSDFSETVETRRTPQPDFAATMMGDERAPTFDLNATVAGMSPAAPAHFPLTPPSHTQSDNLQPTNFQSANSQSASLDQHNFQPPRQVQPLGAPVAAAPLHNNAHPNAQVAVQPVGKNRSIVPIVAIAAIAVLAVATLAAFLAYRSYFAPNVTPATAPTPSPQPSIDPTTVVGQKLADADAALASGNGERAVALLREAVTLDPNNAEIRRKLGDALLNTGNRAEAIDNYRAATERDPNNTQAWRSLAAAEYDESKFAEAAESYRRYFALAGMDAGNASADEPDRLRYADALRQSGKPDEARIQYERLINSANADINRSARQQLATLTQPNASPTVTPTPARNTNQNNSNQNINQNANQNQQIAMATPTPVAPTPTPAPRVEVDPYDRGLQAWQSGNRAAAVRDFQTAAARGNPDAHYYLGLYYAEGRDPKSLQDAALVAALGHFQNASRGRFGGQAQRYAQTLGAEYDRRRKQR